MSVRTHAGSWLAIAVSAACAAAIPLTTAHAQARTTTDAEWLAHCQHQGESDSNRPRVCEVRVQRLPNPQSLTVDGGTNGGVTIIGWDADSVVMHALVLASADSPGEARDIASHVTISVTNGRIRADGPDTHHHQDWSVSYRVFVPRHSDLSAETINGPMSVSGVSGHLVMNTENGPLWLDRVGGDVHARLENGPINIALDGPRWDGAGLDAETENGPVDLSLPANYAAHLSTGTQTGPMDFEFPLTVQGAVDTRHISMDIGGGGPPIRVLTTNGPLTLRHTSE